MVCWGVFFSWDSKGPGWRTGPDDSKCGDMLRYTDVSRFMFIHLALQFLFTILKRAICRYTDPNRLLWNLSPLHPRLHALVPRTGRSASRPLRSLRA